MQKILYFNLYRQERLWLESIYNVEVCTQDEIMSRVRLEECERNIMFILSEAKVEIKVLKFIILLLNCTLGYPNCTVGPPNLGVRGVWTPGLPFSIH